MRTRSIDIAVLLFDGITALDGIGPYEVLQRLPNATVTFVGEEPGEVRSDNGFLGLTVDASIDDHPAPDIVVVPGGVGTRKLVENQHVLDWIKSAHFTTQWTTSVCTGSLVLAAAGLLDGVSAATHWSAYDRLRKLGADPTGERVVINPYHRVITAAGVSAGIDMALHLSALLVDETAAKAMQLMVEYDPKPPFDAGSVDKAGPEVMARLEEYSADKH